MFPFQPNNHDIQDFGELIPYNNPNIPDNFVLNGFFESREGGTDWISTTITQRERLIPLGIQENEERIRNDEVIDERKFVHREAERQRRQEMGNLCGSLRTLVPFEYVEGKRSMCHQLQGAVNYIKDMQSNIHQLKARRDKLKKLSNSAIHRDSNLPNCVTVNPCSNTVEILISILFEEEQGFCLSRILTELNERGFNVVSYFSTKADEKSLHRILFEASSPTSEELSGLQEKLTYIINCPP